MKQKNSHKWFWILFFIPILILFPVISKGVWVHQQYRVNTIFGVNNFASYSGKWTDKQGDSMRVDLYTRNLAQVVYSTPVNSVVGKHNIEIHFTVRLDSRGTGYYNFVNDGFGNSGVIELQMSNDQIKVVIHLDKRSSNGGLENKTVYLVRA